MAIIIGAIIAAAGAGIAAAAQSSANNKANKRNLALANISRQDQLAASAEGAALTRRGLANQERAQAFNEQQTAYVNKQNEKATQVASVNNNFNKAITLLNGNQSLLSNLSNIFSKKAA